MFITKSIHLLALYIFELGLVRLNRFNMIIKNKWRNDADNETLKLSFKIFSKAILIQTFFNLPRICR